MPNIQLFIYTMHTILKQFVPRFFNFYWNFTHKSLAYNPIWRDKNTVKAPVGDATVFRLAISDTQRWIVALDKSYCFSTQHLALTAFPFLPLKRSYIDSLLYC